MTEENQDDKIKTPESSPEATTDATSDSSTDTAGAEATGSPASGSTSDKTESVQTTEKSRREALIAQLTGAAKEDDEETEQEAAEADPAPSQGTTESAAKADGSTEPAKPDVALTEDELVAPVDKHTKPQTRKRIEELIADRKVKVDEINKLKPSANFGESVHKLIQDANMSAEDFGAWFTFGAAVTKDPRNAPLLLHAEAERMARTMGVVLPKAGPDLASIQELEDFIVESVTSMELSGDTAKKLLEKVRATKKTAVPAVQPPQPPVQQQAPPIHNPPSQQQAPTQPLQDPAIQTATQEIGKLQDEYAKAYPADWPKLRESVKAEMAKYTGTDPRHWPRFFKQEVEAAKAKFVVPRKPTIPQTLRPTTSATKPAPSGKAALLAELTGKAP